MGSTLIAERDPPEYWLDEDDYSLFDSTIKEYEDEILVLQSDIRKLQSWISYIQKLKGNAK